MLRGSVKPPWGRTTAENSEKQIYPTAALWSMCGEEARGDNRDGGSGL